MLTISGFRKQGMASILFDGEDNQQWYLFMWAQGNFVLLLSLTKL